ncbi:MAG: N-6 DNA methylase [Candidatus Dormiibacterota bacterium]
MPDFDLSSTLSQLATRNPGRTEADIQAMVREVLVYGGFDLGDDTVRLESPAEEHRRIDVAVGAVLIECKRDIRSPIPLAKAEQQLGEYVVAKSGLYAGVLTDGPIWRLYRRASKTIELVDEVTLVAGRVDERAFRWWLGGLLATEQQVKPTAQAIEERLGAASPSFRLARASLVACWEQTNSRPEVALKRELWAKLLRSALGSQFEDSDELFVDHTYLVLLATLIAHTVAGFGLEAARRDPGVLLSGQLFQRAGLLGVGEAGFFDWLLDDRSGAEIVAELARRLMSFDWDDVDHDVLKALYHSVISPEVRHRLGEYYTPDWLASRIVDQVVTEPISQRVLDPACGSGTFVFYAVRRLLDAAAEAKVPLPEALERVTSSVFGVDLHPVAVSLAQATYLLAIGRERLAQRTTNLAVPIYLGDSMRWESADDTMFTDGGDIVLHTTDGGQLFASELRFPVGVVADVGRFDQLVTEIVDRATTRAVGTTRPSISGLLANLGVTEEERPPLEATYSVLCDLHDAGRDHIWGYYIRNQSRPSWLAQPENRVDVLVGNPPWLAFRFMAASLKAVFERRAKERHLWQGGARGRTTQQDLSAFFVARCVELYLRRGGHFGFVMPRAALSRQTYGGFRSGDYSTSAERCCVAFKPSWDLQHVDPEPFPVPSAVVFGTRSTTDVAKPLPASVLEWTGDAPVHGASGGTLTQKHAQVSAMTGAETASPYRERFRDGAILYPRMLIMITEPPSTSLGVPQGRRAVQSRRTTLDKPPWRDLPLHSGVVESVFIHPTYLGESIAPFRTLAIYEAVIPYDGTRLMNGEDERLDRYPGLASWWRGAEAIWMTHRSSDKRTLAEQLDYMRQLTAQFPISPYRVAYTASGNTLAASVIEDSAGVIEHKLYWAPARTREEANYLAAILNAPALNKLVRPFQSVGAFGPRDFDKYVWQAPIPTFDADNDLHLRIAKLGAQAARVIRDVELPTGQRFQAARSLIRETLASNGFDAATNALLADLLPR